MSRTTDRFRPPYGMRPVESERQCVFEVGIVGAERCLVPRGLRFPVHDLGHAEFGRKNGAGILCSERNDPQQSIG